MIKVMFLLPPIVVRTEIKQCWLHCMNLWHWMLYTTTLLTHVTLASHHWFLIKFRMQFKVFRGHIFISVRHLKKKFMAAAGLRSGCVDWSICCSSFKTQRRLCCTQWIECPALCYLCSGESLGIYYIPAYWRPHCLQMITSTQFLVDRVRVMG